jgi:hypothetical protein
MGAVSWVGGVRKQQRGEHPAILALVGERQSGQQGQRPWPQLKRTQAIICGPTATYTLATLHPHEQSDTAVTILHTPA